MDEGASYLGLVELALTFVLAMAFGVHQLWDLRRERRKREARKAAEEL
jgi:hypothetical protein